MVNTSQFENNVKFLYEVARKANVGADVHDQAAQAAKQLLESFKEDDVEVPNPEGTKKKK